MVKAPSVPQTSPTEVIGEIFFVADQRVDAASDNDARNSHQQSGDRPARIAPGHDRFSQQADASPKANPQKDQLGTTTAPDRKKRGPSFHSARSFG